MNSWGIQCVLTVHRGTCECLGNAMCVLTVHRGTCECLGNAVCADCTQRDM